jgi:enterochelin esterase family protein
MLKVSKQSNLIKKLYEDLQSGDINASNKFWRSVEEVTTPLIEAIDGDNENMLVTVVWREFGEIEKISVIGEFFGFDPDESRLSKIENTDVWCRSFICPSDVRSLYLFSINDKEEQEWSEIDLRIDPLNAKKYMCPKDEENPEKCSMLRELESLLEMPEAKEKKYIKERDNNVKGKLELYRFESEILKNIRRVWVYTPANYNVTRTYDMAIFMDGWEYINIIKTPTILDNLIEDKLIPPICAVFIESTEERSTELSCYKPFTDFLTVEILPWMRKNYNVTNSAEKTVIAGFSNGALAACYAALTHAESFGKVLAQSCNYSWKPEGEEDGWIIRQFEKSPKLPLDFYIDIGTFELRWPFISDSIKRITDVLYSKEYNFKYNIFTGGHVHTDWQDTVADGLIYLYRTPVK